MLLSATIGGATVLFVDSALARFFSDRENTFVQNQEYVQSEAVRLSSRVMSMVDIYEDNWAFHQQERIPLEHYRSELSRQNGVTITASDLTAIPFLLAATPAGIADAPRLETMLHLLRRISAAPAFDPRRNDITMSGYLYSPDRALLAAVPPQPPFESPARLRNRPGAFIDEQVGPVEALLARRDTQALRAERPIWTSWTSTAGTARGQTLAEIIVPIFHGRERIATLVANIPQDQFLQYFVRQTRPAGFFVLSGDAGGPLAHGALSPHDARLLGIIQQHAGQMRQLKDTRVVIRDGLTFIVAQRIEGPGWIAAYVFDWRGIATGMLVEVIASCLLCIGALGLLWSGVGYFDRHVARPFETDAEKLVEAEQFNRSIIDTAPVGIAVFDLHAQALVLENAVAKHLLGGSDGANAALFYRQALRARAEAAAAANAPSPEGHRFFEVHWTAGARERYLGVASSMTRFRGHDAVLLGLVDITERKASEAMLIDARREADRANKAKSMFMAMMTHEIRTPMHGAVGHLELLEHSALDPSQLERVALIRRAFDGLLSLVNDLLDAAKIETHALTVDPRPVSLNRVVEHCAQQFAPTVIGRGIALHCYTDPGLDGLVEADDHRVAQILQNLLSNATKFTQHGAVTLSTALLRRDSGSTWARIEVADTGIGIPSSLQAVIFNPMTQADASIGRRFGGTGLGLFLCRNLAELMGGRITLQSEPETGSVFGVELPLGVHAALQHPVRPLEGISVAIATPDAALRRMWEARLDGWGVRRPGTAAAGDTAADILLVSRAEPAQAQDDTHGGAGDHAGCMGIVEATPLGPLAPSQTGNRMTISLYSSEALLAALLALSGQPRREPAEAGASPYRLDRSLDVLIAEDDPVNRALIEHQLQMLGYTSVRSAKDGREALAMWQAREPDVVVTDVGMPHVGGVELVTAIRERNPGAFVIATTAAGSSDITPAAAALFSHVLLKPVLLADLAEALQKAQAADPAHGKDEHTADAVRQRALDRLDATLREAFLGSWPGEYESIKEALAQRDVNRGRRRLHRLQGALLAMGLDEPAAQCLNLQAICTAGEWEAACAQFEALAQSLTGTGLLA
ncbi:ATP-binding protein [Trinickia caryophylli]|uniref:ATP-binding protein n=1 Tax=Trinickia caryophylli TaxID=28094 RepID=UPI001304B7B8|nr:ATP-binding protein [Trinickia caryophylli]WQE14507.1 ATP-binding protein [Trinickia caryophylli]